MSHVDSLCIILVKSDQLGDRLLFRYPPPPDLNHDEVNKRRNMNCSPYSVARLNNSDAIQMQELLQNNFQQTTNIREGKLSGLNDDVLSTLFAVRGSLCNRKFELKINDVRFVGHPTILQQSKYIVNIVFALHAQASYSTVRCFYDLAKRLSTALIFEEKRCGYLSKEIALMMKLHDDMGSEEAAATERGQNAFPKILENSTLAQTFRTIHHELAATGLLNITINESITLCFCLPQKAHQFHKKGVIVEPEAIDRCLKALKPYHGMLLLVDPIDLLDCVPPSGARILLQLIEVYNPLKSLQNMASDADMLIEHVYTLVGHLVYWAKAIIIYPLCETNVYVIAPDAQLHTGSPLVDKFSAKFPGMSLFEVISDFSLPTSIGHLTTPLQHPSRQGRLAQMVLWMLQHHLLMQLHTYVQFMPKTSTASSLLSSSCHRESEALTEAGGVSVSSQRTVEFDDDEFEGDEEQRIEKLLMKFEENDRSAIAEIPASKNVEDLSLMVNLWQKGYFEGEHHLEEIIYYENLRRSQLLQLLDKFRDVLIIYDLFPVNPFYMS